MSNAGSVVAGADARAGFGPGARVILASADGEGVRPMARRLGVSANTVAVWRRRYRSEGLSGLRLRRVRVGLGASPRPRSKR